MPAGAGKLPSLDIVLGGGKGASGSTTPPGPPSEASDDVNMFDQQAEEPDEMLVGAGQDVMSALRARDSDGFALAMRDFVRMC